jgi:hypothetical protein
MYIKITSFVKRVFCFTGGDLVSDLISDLISSFKADDVDDDEDG